MKILILGDARHGKDTLADIISNFYLLECASSSMFALDTFLYPILIEKYGLKYKSKKEAFKDRVNHRDKWYNEICEYNKDDKIRLAKAMLYSYDVYIGLRDFREVEQAIEENLFDHIIGIYDYRKPRESKESNTADVFKYSDIVLMNNGTIDDLQNKVYRYLKFLGGNGNKRR